jgi:hypothetical protein
MEKWSFALKRNVLLILGIMSDGLAFICCFQVKVFDMLASDNIVYGN